MLFLMETLSMSTVVLRNIPTEAFSIPQLGNFVNC